MISSTDFEKLRFMYQTEGVVKGVSINTYCQQNGIPYNEFEKWFKKTHRAVERLEITGMPQEEEPVATVETPTQSFPKSTTAATQKQSITSKGDILITLKTRDKMRAELDHLKGIIKRPLSDLMSKAVNYMDTFWDNFPVTYMTADDIQSTISRQREISVR